MPVATVTPPTTMLGYTPAGVQAAPPVPCSVPIAAGSVFGSGGRLVEDVTTGCGPAPAAHGLALITASPAARKALAPLVPHVVALWPESSNPSAQIALLDPELPPAEHAPPAPIQVCALA